MAKKRDEQVENTGGGTPAEAPPRTLASSALDLLKSAAVALLLFLVLRALVVQTYVITSSSMEETLLVGDFLVLSKLAYGPRVPFTDWRLPGYSDPERGDVVVFRPPHDPDLDVVKRLVGMPGDTLAMRSQVLFINGERFQEPYVRHTDTGGDVAHRWMRWQCGERVALSPDISGAYRVSEEARGSNADACSPSRDTWGPLVVPEEHYFLMGDNRDNSVDSRYWGFLDEEQLIGEAAVIYYSYDPQLRRPFAFIRNIRPDRIGESID